MKELLEFDGLHEVEKLTGKSYKNDKITELIGFIATVENNQKLQLSLELNKDTNGNTTITEMISYMQEMGFVKLHSKTIYYKERNGSDEKVTQYYYYNYNKYILAVFESYPSYNCNDYRINSAKMYYAIKAEYKDLVKQRVTSSGGYDSENCVWNGDYDIRDAFKFKLNSLESTGEFVPWSNKHSLWFCTYAETKGDYDSKTIRDAVLSCFPEDAKKNMKWYD